MPILVAARTLKLRAKDWILLHSSWTLVMQEKKKNCRPWVIILLDNTDRDKQLNAAYRLVSLGAIILS